MTLQSRSRTYLALLAMLLLYWALSLHQLDVAPAVYEDEPWQASTGWKLATQGVFGSDMFAGYYGMDQHYYGYMPIHPLLQAAIFRIAGLGLFQARLETVVMGLVGLVLTYALGKRLFGSSVGLIAIALMLLTRFTVLSRYQLTGILWLDFTRIARYDAVVPVFGLASLHAYLSASHRGHAGWFALAGLLAGLAGLSHLYGVFWLVVLVILVAWNRAGWKALVALVIGFTLLWVPYLVYVLNGVSDWIGQTRDYAARFDLLNPRWYLDNLLHEKDRYDLGLKLSRFGGVLRPGVWIVLFGLPISLAGLSWQAVVRRDRPARVLLVPALLLPVMFALLIQLKLVNYAINLVPLTALALAWGGMALWRRSKGLSRGAWVRTALAGLLLAVIVEGTFRATSIATAARRITPYSRFIAQVRQHVPAGSRVLGLHHYWFGLSDMDYRSWYVPIMQTNGAYWQPPLRMEDALDKIAPDVILIDPRLRASLNSQLPMATAADPRRVLVWMEQRGYRQIASVEDLTYGSMQIYWLQR